MPSSNSGPQPHQYGLSMGFIFIFNLIVGSGALTLPKAFANSGIFLSLILLIFLSLMSFITATFMFEAMSIMNAIKDIRKFTESLGYSNPVCETESEIQKQAENIDPIPINESLNDNASEDRPLLAQTTPIQYNNRRILSNFFLGYAFDAQNDVIYKLDNLENFDSSAYLERSALEDEENEKKEADNLFAIRKKYEMAEMASVFFNKSINVFFYFLIKPNLFTKAGQFFFYIAMILYLYGDLAIYDAAVPKSLRDTTCTFQLENKNQTLSEDDLCWSSLPSINRMNAYRLYVLLFNLTIGILVFYNVEKTKLLQLLTTVMRWAAFITMIALAIIKIKENTEESINPTVNFVNVENVPNFFGVCIYAFMCHHSLPGIITPMRDKKNYKFVFVGVYLCVLSFYLLLSFTGVYAFGENLNDFYTLNFLPNNLDRGKQGLFLVIIDYYLSLFPVFTISASFPIIGITLRNNLKSLYFFISKKNPNDSRNKNYFTSIGLPLITLIPPLSISLITHDLQLLVGITGSYAGVAIQYIIPSCLVYFGRKEAVRVFRKNYQFKHSFTSPFKSKFWVYFLLLWANLSVIFVTVNHIINKK